MLTLILTRYESYSNSIVIIVSTLADLIIKSMILIRYDTLTYNYYLLKYEVNKIKV